MQDKSLDFWEQKLRAYGSKEWIDKPSIFVQEAVRYFPKTGSILELAAGQGQDSRFLAKLGFEVLSTDRSEFGLIEAKRKAGSENLDIQFKKVDLAKPLPFEAEQFDVVYSHMGLHYFTKKYTAQLFQDIHRLLKPNGILAALFNTTTDPEIIENRLQKIEDNYFYEEKTGLKKRYFEVAETRLFIENLFDPILLDTNGHTYKDGDLGLVRLVCKKI